MEYLPDHEITGQQAERPTLARMIINEQTACLFSTLLYKVDSDTDNLLLCDRLDGIFGPLKSEKGYTRYLLTVMYFETCAIYYVGDKVGLKKLYILSYKR